MPKKTTVIPDEAPQTYASQLPSALVNAFQINNRITEYLIQNLPSEAWEAKTPDGKGRNLAAIVAHIHNVRVMWLKAAKVDPIPDALERGDVTPAGAIKAMNTSCDSLCALMRHAVATDGRIKNFRPDVAAFLGYLIAHDAHHRGQMTMLARQVGHPLPQKAMFGMWEWGKR